MEKNDKNILWKYAGLSTQFLIGIGVFLYAGYRLDHYLTLNTPFTIWMFPLLFITAVIVKIIRDTSKK